MQIIKSAALINKAISSIQLRGAKLDKDIHVAAVSVLAQCSTPRWPCGLKTRA